MNKVEFRIATSIETSVFYSILKVLRDNGWEIKAEYDEKMFDKGIDFDFYELQKNDEIILLAWNNWFEGEIKGTSIILNEIAEYFKITLNFGDPEYLHRTDLISNMKHVLKIKQ